MDTQQSILSLISAKTTIQTITISGYTINYAKAGHGPPLILLHGANIGWAQWYNVISPLCETHTVYALDWPGSGYSTKINFTSTDIISVYTNILEAFIKSLHAKKVSIIAHSVSGVVAIKYTQKYPKNIHKLILVNSMGFTDFLPVNFRPVALRPFAWFLSTVAMRPTKKSMHAFLLSVFRVPIVLPDEFVTHFYHTVIKDRITHPIMFIHSLISNFKIKKDLLCIDSIASIRCPVLVIHGVSDPLIPYKKIVDAVSLLPNGTLVSMEESGHVPSLEQKDMFIKRVRSFL